MIRRPQTLFPLLLLALTPVGSIAPASAETMTLDVCPSDYGGFPADGPAMSCGCAPEAAKAGRVFGANPYYWQTSICRAAVHSGIIGPRGGQIVVTPALSPVFPAVTRNGISGESWRGGSENQGFRIAATPDAAPAPRPDAAPVATAPLVEAPASAPVSTIEPPASTMAIDVCPSDYGSFPAEGPSVSCGCPAEAVRAGRVFGANPYYWQSSVCRAAAHAGLIGAGGGQIVVMSAPPAAVFPATTRNGIVGESWRGGSENRGFEIAAPLGAALVKPVSRVAPSSMGLSVDVCPSDYGSFPADAPSLTCGCPLGAARTGRVFGGNPYYWQSSVCRAATHAGLVGPSGGQIVITPAQSPVFPAVTRNGIAGESWRGGPENQGFRVAAAPGAARPVQPAPVPAPAPRVDNAGQPVQAPVAETLRETGQVALYIRFRFNSADLDISGAPTLMQLRDALLAAPDLRLALVGHTDAVGGRDYNRNLSLKRAEAVMLWLRDEGIPMQRLAIDGKGFDEPIADNATDSGRALNRRVQAIRIP